MATGYQMVVSPGAGNTGDVTTEMVARVLERGGPVEVVQPSNDDELDRAVDAAGDRALVVAGGDGSLHKVVERLWRTRTGDAVDRVIGLVPLGTGNDFARGAGVPLEPEEAAAAIVEGTAHRFDLITDDGGGVAVNAVHVGVGAEAAEMASGLKDLLGAVAYPVGALMAGLTQRGWRIDVELDDAAVNVPGDRVIMVGVANGPSIGGGAELCPPARPDDGALDVVVVAAAGPFARVGFGRDLQKGTHLDRDDVVHRRGQRVRIISEPLPHNADGDLTDEIGDHIYELVPGGWVLLGPTARHRLTLPEVLAGPILRRVDRRQVVVWLATSVDRPVKVEVFRVHGTALEPLGAAPARAARIGERLWAHLAVVRPAGPAAFPAGDLLAYDVVVEDRRVAATADLAYGGLAVPSFHIQPAGSPLRVLHGSCRLLHGHGHDALLAADQLLSSTATDTEQRPAALLLTGDQIYGDEVGGPLAGHLTELGRMVMGDGDDVSVPSIASLARLPVYGRQSIADRAGFTSTKAANHLLSLGEYVAAHLTAFSDVTWPARFPPADAVVGDGETRTERARLRRRYRKELACLEAARTALPAVRRVLANVPTYMCFDDHDVTDDWNITRDRRDGVYRSPTGRRVVANALAAFWAFQGWGNQPDAFADDFVAAVTTGPDGPPDQERFERVMWSFDCWSFVVPTHPPTVVLDTRTQRSYDSDDGAARLMSDAELDRVRALCREAGADGETPAVFVSPVPVFGLEIQERRQKFLAGKLGPYEIDFEAWHSNLQGLVDFIDILVHDLKLRRCVILSGDVHYGLNVDVTFSIGDQDLAVAQIVSSAVKHSGHLARSLLDLLGRLVTPQHERVGWASPPKVKQPTGLARLGSRLMQRSVNSDEWRDDAPVFLNSKLAGTVESDGAPEYRERRAFVAPKERRRFSVIGENNIGDLTLTGSGVVHRHLVPNGPHDTRTFTVEMRWREETP